jgi:hypothetical protein
MKTKINNRCLFCFAGRMMRGNKVSTGVDVYNARKKIAHFETVRIKDVNFCQKTTSTNNQCFITSTLLHVSTLCYNTKLKYLHVED